MGKDWLYWVRIGGGSSGGGGSSSGSRKGMSGKMKETAASAGCMCAVFQMFDFHYFLSPVDDQHNIADLPFDKNKYFLQEEATTSKGVVAPRNSLELDGPSPAMNAAPMSLAMNEENLNFPVGIQIKTSRSKISSSSPRDSTCAASKSRTDEFSSESSSINSPAGTKTPTLVARLMGLDLLPESITPSISSTISNPRIKSRLHQNLLQSRSKRFSSRDDTSINGVRSLPETPRISSARRSDVECQTRRLSLQINKENVNGEFEISDKLMALGQRLNLQPQDENTTPADYAKHFIKQVKDRVVSRRSVGLDITNHTNCSNRDKPDIRRDEILIPLKPAKKKNMSRFKVELSPYVHKSIASSCSPRVTFLDPNKNKQIQNSNIKKPSVPSSSENHQDKKKIWSCGQRCNSSQASDNGAMTRKKKRDPFVCCSKLVNKASSIEMKSTLLSGPNLLQIKKDPSPRPTKLPQKQVSDALSSKRNMQLSNKPTHSYKQLQLHQHKIHKVTKTALPESADGCATAIYGGASSEYENYIGEILKRAGMIKTPFASAEWHSRSPSIHPSIFHHLELFRATTVNSSAAACGGNITLSHRCNRKLIFQLVDELLTEIPRHHFSLKPVIGSINDRDGHSPLVDQLCKNIDSFPAVNCLVLEDIDSLIERDLSKSRLLTGTFEEAESVVCEIEDEIVEFLLRETAASMMGGSCGGGKDIHGPMPRVKMLMDDLMVHKYGLGDLG